MKNKSSQFVMSWQATYTRIINIIIITMMMRNLDVQCKVVYYLHIFSHLRLDNIFSPVIWRMTGFICQVNSFGWHLNVNCHTLNRIIKFYTISGGWNYPICPILIHFFFFFSFEIFVRSEPEMMMNAHCQHTLEKKENCATICNWKFDKNKTKQKVETGEDVTPQQPSSEAEIMIIFRS